MLHHGRRHEKIAERHKYLHGTVEAPYECPVCGEKFNYISEWQDHHFQNHR